MIIKCCSWIACWDTANSQQSAILHLQQFLEEIQNKIYFIAKFTLLVLLVVCACFCFGFFVCVCFEFICFSLFFCLKPHLLIWQCTHNKGLSCLAWYSPEACGVLPCARTDLCCTELQRSRCTCGVFTWEVNWCEWFP